MARGSLTANCSAALNQCSSQDLCHFNDASRAFVDSIRGYMLRHDALLLTEEILATILVGIGSYGQRYRHHHFTRFIFLGATTLFLPIISSVISTVGSNPDYVITSPPNYNSELIEDQSAELSALVVVCDAPIHLVVVVLWAFLVQIVMINTSTIVSVDDREGQSKGPPYQLLVQGLWTLYLGFSLFRGDIMAFILLRLVPPFALLCSKIVLKYYAFEKAQRSYALGHNPGLVYVYMQQLQAQEADQSPVGEEAPPPPLLVMGEDGLQVEEHPHGYAVKGDSRTGPGLVTIDRVWHLDNTLPISTPGLKDLCLSFALFKLLRCRFARYKLTNAGSTGTLTFFRSLLLKVSQHDRVFEVIANELCFIHDYYYSSIPISYSKCCLPFLSAILTLLCIGCCVVIALAYIIGLTVLKQTEDYSLDLDSQIYCRLWCINQHLVSKQPDARIGRSYYDVVPLLFLLVLVVTAEVRDMASYICSNWTKVALICCYVNRASSRHSFCMQKWVSLLLRCRCKLMNHWDEKMSQCSVLTLQPRTNPLVLVRRLLCLPDQRRKVKVPAAVKVCIISALRSSFNGGLSKGVESLRRSQVGESFIWACHGKGTSDIILIWHIATCILEVKYPYQHDHEQGDSTPISNTDHKIAATHLSRYCAYLVTWCPELLPDNKAWSKSLYEAVKKDAQCALDVHPAPAPSTALEGEYEKLVGLLQENSKHEVVKNGVKLGMQLVETIDDEEAIWKLLAEFWSEMILYVAPSNNLKGHSEAIARGGELITLLWAMLFHAGIDSRPGEDDNATATSGGAV